MEFVEAIFRECIESLVAQKRFNDARYVPSALLLATPDDARALRMWLDEKLGVFAQEGDQA